MEERATEVEEVHDARERFQVELARLRVASEDAEDPEKLDALVNRPPHLI